MLAKESMSQNRAPEIRIFESSVFRHPHVSGNWSVWKQNSYWESEICTNLDFRHMRMAKIRTLKSLESNLQFSKYGDESQESDEQEY